jgi:hypothetical protein
MKNMKALAKAKPEPSFWLDGVLVLEVGNTPGLPRLLVLG